MSQSVIPKTTHPVQGADPTASAEVAARPAAPVVPPGTVLSLHGADPTTGRPVTWHVTPLAADGAPGTYLVERVEGEIHNPAVWMQAQRSAETVGEDEVVTLVRSVLFAGSGKPA